MADFTSSDTTTAQRLYETLSLLPLATLAGLPASVFGETAETVVFNLPRTFSTDDALTLEAQAVTDRKFNRMRPSMARVFGFGIRSTQAV